MNLTPTQRAVFTLFGVGIGIGLSLAYRLVTWLWDTREDAWVDWPLRQSDMERDGIPT